MRKWNPFRGGARIDVDPNAIRAMIDDGKTNKEIAKALGVSVQTVSRRRAEMGVPGVTGKGVADRVRELVASGHTIGEIVREAGCSPSNVSRIKVQMRAAGVALPPVQKVAEKRRADYYMTLAEDYERRSDDDGGFDDYIGREP